MVDLESGVRSLVVVGIVANMGKKLYINVRRYSYTPKRQCSPPAMVEFEVLAKESA